MANKQKQFDELLTALLSEREDTNGATPRFDAEAGYQRFQKRVKGHQAQSPTRRWLRYAAAAAVVILIAVVSNYFGQVSVESKMADMTIEAPSDSRSRIVLPDGSIVWLNAGSSLTYSQGFGVKNRDVRMSGEGYFEVTHDKSKPFTVESNAIKVTVLGTKFNVCDYQDESLAEVTLEEGSVAMNSIVDANNIITLTPNQHCILDKTTGRMSIDTTNATTASLWTSGQLFFDEDPLEHIVNILNHSYNVKIRIDDPSIRTLCFYGDFSRSEQTINEVLDILCETGKLKYSYNTDGSIALSRRN